VFVPVDWFGFAVVTPGDRQLDAGAEHGVATVGDGLDSRTGHTAHALGGGVFGGVNERFANNGHAANSWVQCQIALKQ